MQSLGSLLYSGARVLTAVMPGHSVSKQKVEPRLMAITDVKTHGLEQTIKCMTELFQMARPRTVCVQLRDAQLAGHEKLALGAALLQSAQRADQWLAVNDRLDIAALLRVPVIHLAESSVSSLEARKYMASFRLNVTVSRACHQPAALAEIDANMAIVSPALAARKGREALGSVGLREAVGAAQERSAAAGPCRVFALGGITASGLPKIRRCGLDGIAIQGAAYAATEELQGLVQGWGIAR